MARTTKKEITFPIENSTVRELFLTQLKTKIKFVDLQISFKNPNLNIIIQGPRERVLYAINLIRKIHENTMSS